LISQRVATYLISNTVKYSPEGWDRLRCLQEAALVRIEVRDSGDGIPPGQQPYIYDEFYQVGVPTHSARDLRLKSLPGS
jgi:signal transduction histidine kinase